MCTEDTTSYRLYLLPNQDFRHGHLQECTYRNPESRAMLLRIETIIRQTGTDCTFSIRCRRTCSCCELLKRGTIALITQAWGSRYLNMKLTLPFVLQIGTNIWFRISHDDSRQSVVCGNIQSSYTLPQGSRCMQNKIFWPNKNRKPIICWTSHGRTTWKKSSFWLMELGIHYGICINWTRPPVGPQDIRHETKTKMLSFPIVDLQRHLQRCWC